MGYDLDLDVIQSWLILTDPDMETNGNSHDNVIDGNATTCVDLSPVSCGFGFKVGCIIYITVI